MDYCLIAGLFCCIAVGPLWVLGKPLSHYCLTVLKCRTFLFHLPLSFSQKDGDCEDEEGLANPLVFLFRKNPEIVSFVCVL